jgi:hypothetical protein
MKIAPPENSNLRTGCDKSAKVTSIRNRRCQTRSKSLAQCVETDSDFNVAYDEETEP